MERYFETIEHFSLVFSSGFSHQCLWPKSFDDEEATTHILSSNLLAMLPEQFSSRKTKEVIRSKSFLLMQRD